MKNFYSISVSKIWVLVGLRGGINKTIKKLRRRYFRPIMVNEIHGYVVDCEICKSMQPTNPQMRSPITNWISVERSLHWLYITVLSSYPRSSGGNSMTLIVLGHLTNFVLFKPRKKETTSQIVYFLRNEEFCVHAWGAWKYPY